MTLPQYRPPPPMRFRDRRASRVVQTQHDDDQGVQATDEYDAVIQPYDMDRLEQYGLASEPPADVEHVKIPADPIDACHERPARPSHLPTMAATEVCLYGPDGNFVHCKSAGAIDVQSKSGQLIRLGQDLSKAKGVAYVGTSEANASHVAAGAVLEAFTKNSVVDMGAILTDLTTLFTALVLGSPSFTPSITEIPAGTDHSYVSSASAKVGVEP